MLRKCDLTIAGFSFGGASFLALRNFLIKAIGLRFNPREKRLRARLCISSTNWSLQKKYEDIVKINTRYTLEIYILWHIKELI